MTYEQLLSSLVHFVLAKQKLLFLSHLKLVDFRRMLNEIETIYLMWPFFFSAPDCHAAAWGVHDVNDDVNKLFHSYTPAYYCYY